MKVIRIVATDDGESRFTELDIPIENAAQLYGEVVHISNAFTSPHIQFAEAAMGVDMGWHGVRHPQIAIILAGVMEIETGDGEKRQWRAGEIFVADDKDGKHLTRAVEGPVRVLFVRLPTDFVIERWSLSPARGDI